MKKILVLVLALALILNANLCFANEFKFQKEQRKKYQTEIQALIEQKVVSGKEGIDKIYSEASKLYQNYSQNKNLMKQNYNYTEKLNELARSTKSFEFGLYLDLIDATDKYVSLKDKIPATDDSTTLLIFIYPYLKNNKIKNKDLINELSHYADNKAIEIDKLRNEIILYSREYEETKANKFYVNKVRNNGIVNLDNIFALGQYNLSKNFIYTTMAEVIQIVPGGILANTINGDGPTIYIKTGAVQKLEFGDRFNPFLPVKYLGTNYTYTTVFGNRNSVPVFQEILPQEYRQKATPPKINEQFYFIEKPEWENTLEWVGLVNPRLTYKYHDILRPYRSGYKNKEVKNIKKVSYISPPDLTQIEEHVSDNVESESVPKKILKGIGFILLIPVAVAWAMIMGT